MGSRPVDSDVAEVAAARGAEFARLDTVRFGEGLGIASDEDFD